MVECCQYRRRSCPWLLDGRDATSTTSVDEGGRALVGSGSFASGKEAFGLKAPEEGWPLIADTFPALRKVCARRIASTPRSHARWRRLRPKGLGSCRRP